MWPRLRPDRELLLQRLVRPDERCRRSDDLQPDPGWRRSRKYFVRNSGTFESKDVSDCGSASKRMKNAEGEAACALDPRIY